ncbi:MarR family transcriptional regulator [bacterium]|nr:MarR family transcriptional regulator [bacterium]
MGEPKPAKPPISFLTEAGWTAHPNLKQKTVTFNRIGDNSTKANFAQSRSESAPTNDLPESLSEDELKTLLGAYLIREGWKISTNMGSAHGIDILAERDSQRWVIEAKGSGSLQSMRVNYFLAVLGEILQRMSAASAKYSIALPDIQQFRNLWSRLPALAKERTGLSCLFVRKNGEIEEIK